MVYAIIAVLPKNNYTLFCGREKPDSLYSNWYNGDDPLFPNFMKWLDLVHYEYVKAPCANPS